MRKNILLILLIVNLFYISCSKTKVHAYVIAMDGLNLRSDQTLKSSKIFLVPFGSKVTLLKAGKEATIDDITSNWYKIKFNNKIGWGFGGYLNKENTCECNFRTELIGSTFYAKCSNPPGLMNVGGGTLVESNDRYFIGKYEGYGGIIMLSEVQVGRIGEHGCFFIADVLSIDQSNRNKIYYGMNCKSKHENIGIIAVCDHLSDYELITNRAWGVDLKTGKITEINPEDATCKYPGP